MKFLHLSDLHLGKRLYDYSLIDDQKYILEQILQIIDDEKPDGIFISGDIYDKSYPSTEATSLFDDFIVAIAKRNVKTYIISGNHDSAERLSFGSRLFKLSGIHLSQVYDGSVECIEVNDGINIYMLPFIKPVMVKRFFEDKEINNYTDAMRVVIEQMNLDKDKVNILLAHQFVTGAYRSDSEDCSIGGLDNVEADVFKDFDYVALGHIHGPQDIAKNIRYCGTPLKYSFSEVNQEKSATVVEISNKDDLNVRTINLKPKRDLIELKGTYDELTRKDYYDGKGYQDAFIKAILTDEEDVPNAMAKLRTIYHNILTLEYDNTRTRTMERVGTAVDVESKKPMDFFKELYMKQNGKDLSDEQTEFMQELIESIWGDNE